MQLISEIIDSSVHQQDLEVRRKRFYKSIIPYVEKYGKEMCRSFFDYWTEHNEPVHHNTKMRFEKEKTWQLSRRLSTFHNNEQKWTPDYKKKGFKRPFPNYYDRRYAARLSYPEHQQYMMYLQELGFTKGSGPGGSWIKPPGKKIIWL